MSEVIDGKVTCAVCGRHPFLSRDGVCVEYSLIGAPVYWDYMNCPFCGCQILLKKRLRDVSRLNERERE